MLRIGNPDTPAPERRDNTTYNLVPTIDYKCEMCGADNVWNMNTRFICADCAAKVLDSLSVPQLTWPAPMMITNDDNEMMFAAMKKELAQLRAEVKAWQQLVKGDVPERMTAEQFAFMQDSELARLQAERDALAAKIERLPQLVEMSVDAAYRERSLAMAYDGASADVCPEVDATAIIAEWEAATPTPPTKSRTEEAEEAGRRG